MLLYPAQDAAHIREWLTTRVLEEFGDEAVGTLRADIDTMAEAMAKISAIQLQDETEPYFRGPEVPDVAHGHADGPNE